MIFKHTGAKLREKFKYKTRRHNVDKFLRKLEMQLKKVKGCCSEKFELYLSEGLHIVDRNVAMKIVREGSYNHKSAMIEHIERLVEKKNSMTNPERYFIYTETVTFEQFISDACEGEKNSEKRRELKRTFRDLMGCSPGNSLDTMIRFEKEF